MLSRSLAARLWLTIWSDMDDPYKTLGISKTASADEVKKAYRKLAKQHHPDLNPGNAASASRFKDISGAYDLLSDPEKRGRFDRGEIDASGQERADASFYRSHAGGPQGARYRSGPGFDPSDIFADLFSRGGQPGGGFDGSATSPSNTMRCALILGSGTGTAESSASV